MPEPALATEVGDASPPKKGVNRRAIAVRVIAVLAVVQIAAGLWFLANSFDRPAPESWGFRGYQAIISTALLVLGVLVATRRSGNVIGWIFLTRCAQAALRRPCRRRRVGSRAAAERPALRQVRADGSRRSGGSSDDRNRRLDRGVTGSRSTPFGGCRDRLIRVAATSATRACHVGDGRWRGGPGIGHVPGGVQSRLN